VSDDLVPSKLGDGYLYTLEVSGIEDVEGGVRTFSVADRRSLDELNVAYLDSPSDDGCLVLAFSGITVKCDDGAMRHLGKRVIRVPADVVMVLGYDDRLEDILDALRPDDGGGSGGQGGGGGGSPPRGGRLGSLGSLKGGR
jgi:hypothetical protein